MKSGAETEGERSGSFEVTGETSEFETSADEPTRSLWKEMLDTVS